MNRKVEDYIKSTFSSNHEVMANPTCYIYDLEEVTERINEIDRFKLANVSLYYAMKANNHPKILQRIANHLNYRGLMMMQQTYVNKKIYFVV